MFGIASKNQGCAIMMTPVARIRPNPRQPRRNFDHKALLGLAESIKQNGILQPLTVRRLKNGEFELVAGERRLRASLMAGLTQVPCIEVQLDDTRATIMTMLENLQREDLNFFEEADGIAMLIESCGLTQEEIASKLGKNQSTIANKLRLLRLTPKERKSILENQLTERHARALLRVDDMQRKMLLETIIEKKLNVNETDMLVEKLMSPAPEKNKQKKLPVIKDIRLFVNTFTKAVDLMKKAGIDAVTYESEQDGYLEYTVRIPKNGAMKISA